MRGNWGRHLGAQLRPKTKGKKSRQEAAWCNNNYNNKSSKKQQNRKLHSRTLRRKCPLLAHKRLLNAIHAQSVIALATIKG